MRVDIAPNCIIDIVVQRGKFTGLPTAFMLSVSALFSVDRQAPKEACVQKVSNSQEC